MQGDLSLFFFFFPEIIMEIKGVCVLCIKSLNYCISTEEVAQEAKVKHWEQYPFQSHAYRWGNMQY